jgi:hypothetical protein
MTGVIGNPLAKLSEVLGNELTIAPVQRVASNFKFARVYYVNTKADIKIFARKFMH